MKFSVGDQVKLTEDRYADPVLPAGTVGVITELRPTVGVFAPYIINFPERPRAYPPECVLALHAEGRVPSAVGDRVVYVAGNDLVLPAMIGKRGTATGIFGSTVSVAWDDESVEDGGYMAANLRKIDNEETNVQTAIEAAEQRARRAEAALEIFKQQVAEVATRYGYEHDLCSVLDDALAELGLSRLDPPLKKITVLIETVFYAHRTDGSYEDPSEEFVEQSVNYDEARLDSDWDEDSSEARLVSVTVEDDDR